MFLNLKKKWSKWLGVKYSVFVNSGSSANLLSISILKELYNSGEIIVPSLTWVSDIAAVIQNGLKPIFTDINLNNLAMNEDEIIKKINKKTKAVFLSHIQGFNGLSDKLLRYLKLKKIPLVEDVCESHGATFKNKKLGSIGLISDFSFFLKCSYIFLPIFVFFMGPPEVMSFFLCWFDASKGGV